MYDYYSASVCDIVISEDDITVAHEPKTKAAEDVIKLLYCIEKPHHVVRLVCPIFGV